MMRSLYSGVSGLKNHQIRMDVIGNNISNVNTNGFKAERVTFQDMISQEMSGASEPRENIGGVNPKQIGLGMTVASVDKLMTQGAFQTTNKNTDVAISGSGFFILADGDKNFYTRNGNFDVDKNQQLVNPSNGMKVQGWNAQTDANGNSYMNTASTPEDIIIPLYSKEPAKETSYVVFKSNLNSAAEAIPADATDAERYRMIVADSKNKRGHMTSITTYDDKGEAHQLRVFIWKTDNNRWMASVDMSNAENLTVDVEGAGQNTTVPGNKRFEISFTPDGRIAGVSDGIDADNTGQLNAQITFRIPGNPEPRTLELRLGESQTIDGVTQFSTNFTTKAVEQDGYPMGYFETFSIDDRGVVTAVYDNGMTRPIAQIAMANFINPEGLTKAGSTNFAVSNNSGEPLIGEAGIAGLGSIRAGFLEMSNVNLADEFTDMIVTQRGFQANSRSITTSDQMLQELLTLKR